MRSGHAATAAAPVVAAGVGVRYGSVWVLRLASFTLIRSESGRATLGIAAPRAAPASATLVDLLAGRTAPGYGSLRVLGHDLGTPRGRALARQQIGVASRTGRIFPAVRVRGLVECAARRSVRPGSDRHLLVAAVLDRLGLTPWAEVPLRAAPDLVLRRARVAAACVHQPKLLIAHGLLDELGPRDRAVLTDLLRDIERDTAVVAIGRDPEPLAVLCDRVLTLDAGIVVDVPEPAPDAPAPVLARSA